MPKSKSCHIQTTFKQIKQQIQENVNKNKEYFGRGEGIKQL
jgi:hypothetical protein